MDERVGESGERVPPGRDDDLTVEPGRHQVEHAGRRLLRGHPLTPIRTRENRAGIAGCPVRPTWTGWPLPQLGVPQNTVSEGPASMSSVPQNRGVMPV